MGLTTAAAPGHPHKASFCSPLPHPHDTTAAWETAIVKRLVWARLPKSVACGAKRSEFANTHLGESPGRRLRGADGRIRSWRWLFSGTRKLTLQSVLREVMRGVAGGGDTPEVTVSGGRCPRRGLTDVCIQRTASDQRPAGEEGEARTTRRQALRVTEATRHGGRSHLWTRSQPASGARRLRELGQVP